jgi:hypothetical protein
MESEAGAQERGTASRRSCPPVATITTPWLMGLWLPAKLVEKRGHPHLAAVFCATPELALTLVVNLWMPPKV